MAYVKRKSGFLKRLFFFVFYSFFIATGFSQTATWTGAKDNNWNDNLNWSNNTIPTATTDVTIADVSLLNYPTINTAATCNSLKIGGLLSGKLTVNANLVVTNGITINATGSLTQGSSTITLKGNWTSSGAYIGGSNSFVVFAGATQYIGGSNPKFSKLTVNAGSTVILNSDVVVDVATLVNGIWDPNESPSYKLTGSTSFTVSATGTARVKATTAPLNYGFTGGANVMTGSTIDYCASSGIQTVYSDFAYSDLRISGGGVKQLSGDYVRWNNSSADVGNVYVVSGTLDLFSYSLSRGATGGLLSVSNGAALRIGGVSSLPIFLSYSFGPTSTVEYYGSTQTVTAGTYGNLIISSTGTKTAGGILTIVNDFTLTTATFNSGAYTHKVGGNWSMASGVFSNASNTIQFNGTANQNISSTGAFNIVNINKTAGTINLTTDITIKTLSFTKGTITTGSKKVIIPSTGSVTGALQTTGWVAGNLQKYFSTSTGIFEVGTATYYSPVNLTFTSITAGNLIGGITATNHPNISTSSIPLKNIKLYWSIAKPASGAVGYTALALKFNWNTSDNYSPIVPAEAKVALFNSGSWTYPTISGTPATSTMSVSGVSALGDFAIGEPCPLTPGFSYPSTTYCANAANASVILNPGSVKGIFSAPAGLIVNNTTGVVNIGTSQAGIYSVTNTVGTGACTVSASVPFTIQGLVGTPAAITIAQGTEPTCVNLFESNVTYTASAANSTSYNWSIDNNLAGTINATTGAMIWKAGFSGTVKISVNASGCDGASGTVTKIVTVNAPGTWTGALSTSWSNPANWLCYVIPDSSTNVIIPSGLFNYPLIVSTIAKVKDLTLQPNSSLTITNGTLKVRGNISSQGVKITSSNGKVELNGSTAQTIPANIFAGNILKDLVINNAAGVTLGGALRVTNSLSFGNVNNAVLNANGYLTLTSTSGSGAHVLDVTNGGVNSGNNIIGNVTVERFVQGKRAYRFLTAPVNSTTSVKANWMENSVNAGYWNNVNPNPGFGTNITGAGGNANGFDYTQTNNPSMFTFNNSTQNWSSIPNTNITLQAGSPFRVMVRGSRSVDLSINTPSPSNTILRASGSLVTGDVVMTKANGGGTINMPNLSAEPNTYSFVGNPYACAVNWLSISKNDISSTIYIYDPTISGTNGRGAYVAYNGALNVNNQLASLINNSIQSGQAFFVQTTGPNPSLTFRETDKMNSFRPVFRTVDTTPRISVQLQLARQSGTDSAADGVVAFFANQFDNAIGDEDSYKLNNLDENLAINSNKTNLSIEGRKMVVTTDTLKLKTWQLNKSTYNLRINQNFFPSVISTYLFDAYLNTTVPISNTIEKLYNFTVNADSGSFAADRFRIVFSVGRTLPVEMGSIKAYTKGSGVQVDWVAKSESNLKTYVVERSSNARNFNNIGSVDAKENPAVSSEYTFHDASPLEGDNYYRIKSVDKAGAIKYSEIAKVSISESTEASLSIMPNPVKGNTINLSFNGFEKGTYTINLINGGGQIVYSSKVLYEGGNFAKTIKASNTLPAGVYQLRVQGNAMIKSIPILVE